MLRRFYALILVLACALAPALPAHEVLTVSAAQDCGCDHSCCNKNPCAPPANDSTRTATVAMAGVEQRAAVAKPARRVALLRLAQTVLVLPTTPANALRPAVPARIVPADSVALFQAHCSFLL